MKGSVGTATTIVYSPNSKKKYKNKRKTPYFCVKCRGWIGEGKWFSYTRQGTTRHAYPNDCKRKKRNDR